MMSFMMVPMDRLYNFGKRSNKLFNKMANENLLLVVTSSSCHVFVEILLITMIVNLLLQSQQNDIILLTE